MTTAPLTYLTGFGNEHETEALSGALPIGQFNPQRVNYGLYAEQFSTTAFTTPRARNRRTWFYRIHPSVVHGDFKEIDKGLVRTAPITEATTPPDQLRWDPMPEPTTATDFIDGLVTIAANGDASAQYGVGIHHYALKKSMDNRACCNADGELLFIPQLGQLVLRTECGRLQVEPGEIAVIPRGLKFSIDLLDDTGLKNARGYLCENYGAPLELPERGPVGANGFANNRDFLFPAACYEDDDSSFELITKFNGNLFRCELNHSPFDVVAWVGNSAPYKYDLSRFNVINTVSYDHPDPSIFTVLSSPSNTLGVANLDFVIFPPRWMVAENTFRPPWFHRNVMSEFMGLIKGVYDAKEEGFVPGGASLHNCMTAHGPEAAAFEKASAAKLLPERYLDTLAFMLESKYIFKPTKFALETDALQSNYHECWRGLKKHFNPNQC